MKRRLALLFAVLLVVPAAYAGPAAKSLELPEQTFDRAAHFHQMSTLHARLSASMVERAFEVPLEVSVDPADRGTRDRVGSQQKMQVGVVAPLAVPVSFGGARPARGRVTLHDTFGALRGTEDGGFVWAGVLRSPEAAASRIYITGLDLPAGAELFVYSRDGMAFGPYTGRGPNGNGELWTNTVVGAEVVVQLHARGVAVPDFTISGFGHLTPDFAMARNLKPVAEAGTQPCAFNASCVVDAACTQTNSAVNTAADAVAHILFASGAYLYICTGGLVADSDASSEVPYFLTANHCISRSSEAASMETFFFYKASTCGSCPDPGAANTNGASIVASNRTSDYTLMRLSQAAPAGAAFLGWSSTAVANANGTALYRLSHPQGAPQSYSEHVVDTSKVTCQSWPRGNWIYSRDILGATEGGSSGSPVVNAAGQIVGQLSGGCGYNVSDECDSASNATVDGAFAAYYGAVQSILGSGDGGGGCTDNDGDGYCVADGDCNDNNASIHPGANDTKGKNGRNGIDNNCNGVIDG
jgi:V8-like Glu-specific endopeptidase